MLLRDASYKHPDASSAVLGPHRVVHAGVEHEGLLIDRDGLRPGHAFEGPAVVVEYSTTTLVPPGTVCRVDEWGNLVLGLTGRANRR